MAGIKGVVRKLRHPLKRTRFFRFFPGTAVPGFHIPPLRG